MQYKIKQLFIKYNYIYYNDIITIIYPDYAIRFPYQVALMDKLI